MYSEFIEMSGKTENYISYVEYSTFIEPIYMESELSKADFIALLKNVFEKLVYPAVERAIHKLSLDDKLAIIDDCCPQKIIRSIEEIDFNARKIAYAYMKLFTRI